MAMFMVFTFSALETGLVMDIKVLDFIDLFGLFLVCRCCTISW